MKFGINLFIWTLEFDKSHAPLLAKIKAGGFDSVEPALFNPATFQARALKRACADTGLEATLVSVIPGDMSLITEDAAVRAATIDHVKAVVATAAEAGVSVVAGPMYSPVGFLPGRRRTADEWKRCVDSYGQLGPALAEHNVHIAIEPLNRFETFFLNTAEDAARLCDEIDHPNVGILFDTFHANIEEKNIADGYRTVAKHLKHVHTCENDRGTPGTGHIEWTEVFAALKEIGYDGTCTIESFGGAVKEIAAAAAIWRDLAPSPEALAFDGLRFLRGAAR